MTTIFLSLDLAKIIDILCKRNCIYKIRKVEEKYILFLCGSEVDMFLY